MIRKILRIVENVKKLVLMILMIVNCIFISFENMKMYELSDSVMMMFEGFMILWKMIDLFIGSLFVVKVMY